MVMKNNKIHFKIMNYQLIYVTLARNIKGRKIILSKRWLLGLFLAVSLFVITACSDGDKSGEENNEQTETQEETQDDGETAEQPEMPEADLEGLPEVVAVVDGEEIPKEEFEATYQGQFQQMAMQSQMTGQEVDQDQLKKQVAESMIGTQLLIKEANNREIAASEEDIDEIMDGLIEQNELESKEELMNAFEAQGMDEEELMSQVETQVIVNKLITEESGDIQPTEEELQETYDQLIAQQEEMAEGESEIPSFEEMKPNLEEQLKMQKEGEAAQTLVEKLRDNADVTINL